MARFYTTETISENREKTPEGFLLCKATPIARIGTQVYTAAEVPEGIEPDESGLVLVDRPEEEVFHPDAIASAEGKTFTLDHPDQDVTPDNWRELAHGHMQNVRRGEDDKADLLICDLLIMSREGIEAVEGGKVQLSNGYDVIYEPAGKGKAVQRNPRINHVALVDAGRCGWRCAIGDSNPMRQDAMAKTTPNTKSGVFDAFFRSLFRAAKDEGLTEEETKTPDEDGTEQEPTPAPEETTQDNPVEAKLDQVLAALTSLTEALKGGAAPADEKPDQEDSEPGQEENEEAAKAGDARAMDAQELRARADILAPGRTFDGKKPCDTMRSALDAAYPAHKSVIDAFTRGVSDFKNMDCITLEAAFIGASELIKARNNQSTADAATMTAPSGTRAMDNATLNQTNADFWNSRQSGK